MDSLVRLPVLVLPLYLHSKTHLVYLYFRQLVRNICIVLFSSRTTRRCVSLGYTGSAVCKAALARGMRVTSLSSSGRPFRTPKGHLPAWTERVEWRAGDALKAGEDISLFNGKTAVVHTLGILFESGGGSKGGYKQALKSNDPLGFVSSVAKGISSSLFGGGRNPLEEGGGEYERMNRDSGLFFCCYSIML